MKMTLGAARALLGDRAAWELQGMVKANSMLRLLNTKEDEQRLLASKILLAAIRRGRRRK